MKNQINKKNTQYKIIPILPEFKDHLENLELLDRTKTIYALRIKVVIGKEREKNNNKSITLFQITKDYNNIYIPNISISTVNRVSN